MLARAHTHTAQIPPHTRMSSDKMQHPRKQGEAPSICLGHSTPQFLPDPEKGEEISLGRK